MKVAIIGNSGSGKTTLARRLAADTGAAVLDLDTVFWEPGVAVERTAAARLHDVQEFCRRHEAWIVEGCYADLIEAALAFGPELVFLDPAVLRSSTRGNRLRRTACVVRRDRGGAGRWRRRRRGRARRTGGR